MKKVKGILLVGVLATLLSMSLFGSTVFAGQEPEVPGPEVVRNL